ncbi:MAG: bifunctional hydroxymethylpyrimidine kinase/phosphomethylpyrimidine kinase, partial [Lachnospiraceae bacterium]|nr:bifunctional hydroxymethylpyrimidine kinase/phosphomethylpyrimidine kinase [Lachnospiraceae bacterium]
KERAKALGKTVIIDPAPAVSGLPDEFWKGADFIKPNETELSILTGLDTSDMANVIRGAHIMLGKGVKAVLVSLGEKGVMYVSETEEKLFPARKVKAVDTTAAGDSFTAGFCLALSEGRTVDEAVVFGQKVAAIAVTRHGAQSSIPTREEAEMHSLKAADIREIDWEKYGRLYELDAERAAALKAEGMTISVTDIYTDVSTDEPIMKTLPRLGMTATKKAPFIAKAMERHAATQEVQLPTDQDVVFCLADSEGEPKADDVVPVILRKGQMFVIKEGIWHTESHGLEKDGSYYWMSSADGTDTWHEIEGGAIYISI